MTYDPGSGKLVLARTDIMYQSPDFPAHQCDVRDAGIGSFGVIDVKTELHEDWSDKQKYVYPAFNRGYAVSNTDKTGSFGVPKGQYLPAGNVVINGPKPHDLYFYPRGTFGKLR